MIQLMAFVNERIGVVSLHSRFFYISFSSLSTAVELAFHTLQTTITDTERHKQKKVERGAKQPPVKPLLNRNK